MFSSVPIVTDATLSLDPSPIQGERGKALHCGLAIFKRQ